MTQETEPLVPYADIEDLPEALRERIKHYVKRMGFLPNALKLYMHRPELMTCLIDLNNTVMRDESSHLDTGLKRRISLVCSALNKSAYCVAHNAGTLSKSTETEGEGWGFDEDQLEEVLAPDYTTDDPVENAAMAFARAATIDPADVPREVAENLKKHLTPPQVVELACVVGFWKLYNTIHEGLYIPLEDELLDGSDLNSHELWADSIEPIDAKAEVEIFSTKKCPFCRRAKRLLAAKGVEYTEYQIDADPKHAAAMAERTNGAKTVPQIFVNGELIGGMDELAALEKMGELNPMLMEAA